MIENISIFVLGALFGIFLISMLRVAGDDER